MNVNDIRGAIARGWTTEENSHKEMDVDLAEAILLELLELFLEENKNDRS